MEIFQMISLLAELLVVVLAAAIAVKKKKTYGWLFAVSFALWLIYDAVQYLNIAMDGTLKDLMLLAGALLSLAALWQLYQKK